MSAAAPPVNTPSLIRQFNALTKPRVIQLIVFCALIGMVLAVPGVPGWREVQRMVLASLGIWFVAGAAAAFNCLVEKGIDAKMRRTAWRPTARGELSDRQALLFSSVMCAIGSALLYWQVNPLTMWLTFATFVGYAVIYTVILKPLTPQNIVIGGASGAMPPVLGWAAMTGDVGPEALILFLIIFLWTPPHFWALALYRVEDYRKSGLPMLPVTHGNEFTRLQVLLYTLVLFAACLMPFIYGMSAWLYLGVAVVLSASFIGYAFALWRPLLRRAGPQDLPLLPHPPERAVRCLAGGPLPFPGAMNKRNALKIAASGVLLTLGFGLLGGCSETRPAVSRGRHHRRRLCQGSAPARPQWPAAQHGRLQGQGRHRLLRLHPVPGRLPHLHGRTRPRSRSCWAPDGDKLQGIFVTVDPERDTAEMLKAYMTNFDPSFLALIPTPEQLTATAKDFKVYYKRVEGKTPTSYTMDHSAGSYMYDPQGRLRLYNRYGSGAPALAADVKLLLKGS
jgi:protoheme IX farnesyltransferase